jgi:FkbM family methyltransferase
MSGAESKPADFERPATSRSTHRKFLGDEGLSSVLSDLSFKALDVGARGGFLSDLLPLARRVDAIGFEPDIEECDRLNAAVGHPASPWKSLVFLPVALGSAEETRALHLYRERGCSSLLEANLELARQFSREDYFLLDATVPVRTVGLDTAAARHGFQDAVFMKIDIQGAEHEVLGSGSRLLSESLLALRVEVEFEQQYRSQALFSDVDALLRSHGMVAMDLMGLSEWRRSTKVKHPELHAGPIPYSRGQLIHGDVLYFKDPDRIQGSSESAVLAQIQAAFLAIVYAQVDHAAFLLGRDPVRSYLETRYGLHVMEALANVSRRLGRADRRKRWRDVLREIRSLIATRL